MAGRARTTSSLSPTGCRSTVTDSDGETSWRRSPGGLVTALAPMMRPRRRLGRLARPPDDEVEPFARRMDSCR